MSGPDDRLLELIRAAREEATMGRKDDLPVETLLAYLRGELGVEERLEIQERLAASPELRADLLELAELEDEEAAERFDAIPAPAIPALRTGAARADRRRWTVGASLALAAVLVLALLPRMRATDPVAVEAEQWRQMTRLSTEQFEPSTLRGADADLPPTMPSPRLALVVALLDAVEWDSERGWVAKADLVEAELTRNGAAFELTEAIDTPTEGVAFFDPETRTLWSHPLAGEGETPTRFAFPGPATPDWLLLRWWREGEGFRASPVAGHF